MSIYSVDPFENSEKEPFANLVLFTTEYKIYKEFIDRGFIDNELIEDVTLKILNNFEKEGVNIDDPNNFVTSNNLYQDIDELYEKCPEIFKKITKQTLYQFYTLWQEYFRTPGFSIIINTLMQNSESDMSSIIFTDLFNYFENFYNEKNGREIEVIEEDQSSIGGGIVTLTFAAIIAILLFFLTTTIINISRGTDSHDIIGNNNTGTKTVLKIIKNFDENDPAKLLIPFIEMTSNNKQSVTLFRTLIKFVDTVDGVCSAFGGDCDLSLVKDQLTMGANVISFVDHSPLNIQGIETAIIPFFASVSDALTPKVVSILEKISNFTKRKNRSTIRNGGKIRKNGKYTKARYKTRTKKSRHAKKFLNLFQHS